MPQLHGFKERLINQWVLENHTAILQKRMLSFYYYAHNSPLYFISQPLQTPYQSAYSRMPTNEVGTKSEKKTFEK
jgi:hypothetical protein